MTTNFPADVLFYIAVMSGADSDGKAIWDLVEEFQTEAEAQQRLPYYLTQGIAAQVMPVRFVLQPEIMQDMNP